MYQTKYILYYIKCKDVLYYKIIEKKEKKNRSNEYPCWTKHANLWNVIYIFANIASINLICDLIDGSYLELFYYKPKGVIFFSF